MALSKKKSIWHSLKGLKTQPFLTMCASLKKKFMGLSKHLDQDLIHLVSLCISLALRNPWQIQVFFTGLLMAPPFTCWYMSMISSLLVIIKLQFKVLPHFFRKNLLSNILDYSTTFLALRSQHCLKEMSCSINPNISENYYWKQKWSHQNLSLLLCYLSLLFQLMQGIHFTMLPCKEVLKVLYNISQSHSLSLLAVNKVC